VIKRVFALMLIIVMAGCSTESIKPNTLSVDDLCIHRDDDKKNKVCYGMSRSDAEKVLGTGEKSIMFKYDYGVGIIYRDDKIVSIALDQDSKNVYNTIRGSKIGNLKEDVLTLYGDKYPIIRTTSPQSLDYVYDIENNKFIGEVSYEKMDKQKLRDHLFVSTVFNEDGYVNRIFLSDLEAIMLMR